MFVARFIYDPASDTIWDILFVVMRHVAYVKFKFTPPCGRLASAESPDVVEAADRGGRPTTAFDATQKRVSGAVRLSTPAIAIALA